MRIVTISFLILFGIWGCEIETKYFRVEKPIEQLKAFSDLSSRLHVDILKVANKDYFTESDSSTNTTDINKLEIALRLYDIAQLVNILTYQFKTDVFSKSNNLSGNQQDTASYEYILNNYTNPFEKDLLNDTIIKNKFMRLQACQELVIRIKKDIIKTQFGKGRIICRDLGPRISIQDFNAASDYWDLLYLIENTHYTICKDILCAFSNLSCYKKEIRWRYSTPYFGNPDEAIRRTAKLKKKENGT